MKTRTVLSFDNSVGERLPKSVGYAGLFRWALHIAVDTEKEFEKAVMSDAGLAAADRYMVGRVKRLLGK